MAHELISVRVDKWLWAARFFKTRQLASKAIKTGKIAIDGQIVSKPAATIRNNSRLSIKRGPYKIEIMVDALSEQRGSATVAQTLYHETAQSIAARETLKEQLASQPQMQSDQHKPDKRGVRSQRALKRGS